MKKLLGIALLLALVAAASWLVLRRSNPPAAEVRVGYPPIVASLPVFIAEDAGLFKESGVGATLVPFTSSNDMVNALVAGQLDILPAVSLIPLVHLEIQQPGTVRLFSHSRMAPERAFDSIIVLKESSVRGLPDLASRKIGVFPGTSAANMLKAFLTKHNVDAGGVTFVQMPPPSHLASLDSGAVDALFTYEPVTTAAAMTDKYRTLFGSVYADLQAPCPIGASAISRRYERDHAGDAGRAVAAIDNAVLKMRASPEWQQRLLPSKLGFSSDIAGRVNVVDVTLSSELDVDGLQRFIDLLYATGEIPKKLDARTLVEPTK